MAKKRQKKLLLDNRGQREALTSPVRLEILEHLGLIGPASVRDLAERMDRTPHSLHYHVRQLAEVGIIVKTGSRRSGVRDQALYDVAADRFEMAVDPDEADEDRLEAKALRAALRRAERDFAALIESDPGRLAEEAYVGRLRAPLSTGGRKEVLKHVKAIERIFTREFRAEHPPQARVETFTFTVLMLPKPSEQQ